MKSVFKNHAFVASCFLSTLLYHWSSVTRDISHYLAASALFPVPRSFLTELFLIDACAVLGILGGGLLCDGFLGGGVNRRAAFGYAALASGFFSLLRGFLPLKIDSYALYLLLTGLSSLCGYGVFAFLFHDLLRRLDERGNALAYALSMGLGMLLRLPADGYHSVTAHSDRPFLTYAVFAFAALASAAWYLLFSPQLDSALETPLPEPAPFADTGFGKRAFSGIACAFVVGVFYSLFTVNVAAVTPHRVLFSSVAALFALLGGGLAFRFGKHVPLAFTSLLFGFGILAPWFSYTGPVAVLVLGMTVCALMFSLIACRTFFADLARGAEHPGLVSSLGLSVGHGAQVVGLFLFPILNGMEKNTAFALHVVLFVVYTPLLVVFFSVLREAALQSADLLEPRSESEATDLGDELLPVLSALKLTRREREVFLLVLNGQDTETIARNLFVSASTVKWHVANLLRKSGKENRAQLLEAYQALAPLPQPGQGVSAKAADKPSPHPHTATMQRPFGVYFNQAKAIVVLMVVVGVALAVGLSTWPSHREEPDPRSPVVLTLWYNLGGQMKQAMTERVDVFNRTLGKEKGIVLSITSFSGSAVLHDKLKLLADGVAGAPQPPDIVAVYPKTALVLARKKLLADLAPYFSAQELAAYVPRFLEEGILEDGKLYVFPVAKSTEALFVNKTFFDRFARSADVSLETLSTMEGLVEAARRYYAWTDAQTPDTPRDGAAFFSFDSPFNFALAGCWQLGDDLLSGDTPNFAAPAFEKIWRCFYEPAIQGHLAVYDGYGSDLMGTGEIVCNIGSTAGIGFYPAAVTHPDNTAEPVEFIVLPYPVFQGGKKIAIQRGAGLSVLRSTPRKERAAAIFLQWLTDPERNLRFLDSTGYLPVTQKAFDTALSRPQERPQSIRDHFVQATILMQRQYDFMVPPLVEGYDALQKNYESDLKNSVRNSKKLYFERVSGSETAKDAAALQAVSESARAAFTGR